MKLINRILVFIGCCIFGVHFILVIIGLTICYFFKALYYKVTNKGDFKMNPFSHINPEVLQPTMTILTLDGYKIQTYDFKTQDDCTLTTWRVKNISKPAVQKYPVFLQHGLLDCSISWFLQQDKTKSLPYLLANSGYDVWLGNNRGTKYSNHQQNRQGFWDYSFDELAKYDTPAFINGILKETNSEQIIYVGHSQGSTQLFAHLTEQEQNISLKIKAFIALGPVISLKNVKNHPVLNLASKTPVLQLYSLLGFKSFLHLPRWLSKCVGILIYNTKFYMKVFLHVVNVLCGHPQNNKFDLDKFGVIITHEPGGASVNNLKHWIQLTKTEHLRKFDFGIKKNIQVYGTEQPPQYKFQALKKLSFNKYLFRGSKDAVISEIDFNLLLSKLQDSTTFNYVLEDYAHLDYIWGTCAPQILYDRVMSIIAQQSN